MGGYTLKARIKGLLSGIGWKMFIYFSGMTEDSYFKLIYKQELARRKAHNKRLKESKETFDKLKPKQNYRVDKNNLEYDGKNYILPLLEVMDTNLVGCNNCLVDYFAKHPGESFNCQNHIKNKECRRGIVSAESNYDIESSIQTIKIREEH